ncbi:MAG: hypothetical protein OXG72_19725 [Acidobacteria bacterium]|nr:hypothetical protein [Acidobacteriota bacterium]
MRTTLGIRRRRPERREALAAQERKPLGQFVSELRRGALLARGGAATGRPRERYGFRPIPAGEAMVTDEAVNEIRDDLGV